MARGPQRRRWREAVWALLLASLLSAGVLGVLLLNTAMQQQAIRLDHQQTTVSSLRLQAQALQVRLERFADPSHLLLQAKRLHMHPAKTVRWPGLAPHHRRHGK